MARCSFCKKKKEPGRGTFFNVPEDEKRRRRWSKICGVQLSASSRLCGEHFLASDIIKAGQKFFLMPNANPFIQSLHKDAVNVNGQPRTTAAVITRDPEQITYENSEGVFGENLFIINNNIPSTQLQLQPVVQVSCGNPVSTQTNLRLCGTVQVSDFGDEYRFNCFYCCETFPLEKWEKFISHLRKKHFDYEEAFQIPVHDTKDHDSTRQESPWKQSSKKQSKNTQKSDQNQTSNKTALSHFLKRSNTIETEAEEGKISTTEIFRQQPTEISFEYTPQEVIDFLLDNMKNYPVLWEFDEVPFNEDYYEAIEQLCQIINDKWSLNIDNLQLRRSINRVLSFYCSFYSRDNFENIKQFANYYDKCAKFLPKSVHDIAYARCSHCYGCYQNNNELKSHLLGEHKYLQWPYKCVQCNECFRNNDELEFHKRLPHYQEKIVESKYTNPLSLGNFNLSEENKSVTFETEIQFNDSANTVNNEPANIVLSKNSKIEEKPLKNRTMKQSSKKRSKNTQKNNEKQTSNKTALSRCLKRSNTIETLEADKVKISTTESFLQKPSELSFEYTPREIIDFLLDNMKNYPVLWEFDEVPFNEDYYEAIEKLCQIINDKWSLNIDALKLRRSVNRVLNFYCSLYPCDNTENINQFANYYNKCAKFLPASVHDIGYARCSHCYRCYENSNDLRSHLVEENKYLQWPYQCVQCKECFRDSDEFEFHIRLPHYEEEFVESTYTSPLSLDSFINPLEENKSVTSEIESQFNDSSNTVHNEKTTFVLSKNSKIEKKKPLKNRTMKQSFKKQSKNIQKRNHKQTSNKTALSRCLKRSNTIETLEADEDKISTTENFLQKPSELSFEYTPREIIDFLLHNIKKYPVLWTFDEVPFNEDYYKSIEELCQIINDKWSLNIDTLQMRRSVNRVLNFYCSLYPCDNVENINQFANYYDKCAEFLPASVHDIAYARCSHCYKCYENNSELRSHLVEENKYLQWPYKCVQCKECFRDSDEFEFHKRQPHYEEVFRCKQCNKQFIHRHRYKEHVSLHQIKQSDEPGKHICNICGKAFKRRNILRAHKVYHQEKKLQCHLCPKSFITNGGLKKHLKIHTKEYDFMCEVCGKKCIESSSLRQHMNKHTGAKVSCNICDLEIRKCNLLRHLRVAHVPFVGTVESTYRAKGYRSLSKKSSFCTKSEMYLKYSCKICKIRFESQKKRREHNKEFHSDPKFSCKLCSSEFTMKPNLKRHYRIKHELHRYQIFKLMEDNEDLATVLAINPEDLDELYETLTFPLGPRNVKKRVHTIMVKSDPFANEICIEEERIQSDAMQNEIMKANNIDNEMKINVDFLSNL